MTNKETIQEFWRLATTNKSAALDINTLTGQLVVQATKNLDTGAVGIGTPGEPYTVDWERIILSTRGVLSRGPA